MLLHNCFKAGHPLREENRLLPETQLRRYAGEDRILTPNGCADQSGIQQLTVVGRFAASTGEPFFDLCL
jgi:hypothetical protein